MRRSLKSGLVLCGALACASWACAGTDLNSALQAKPDLLHGERLFNVCAACHLEDGSGQGPEGIPIIAAQHYQYILKELVDFRSTRRLNMRMEAIASRHELLNAQDLADVAGFIAAMPIANTADFGSGKHTDAGRVAYQRDCALCHGDSGQGNAQKLYPRLAGQHYTYLLNQIDAMIGGYRFNVGQSHEHAVVRLTDDEITGVADYLARLRFRAPERERGSPTTAAPGSLLENPGVN